MLCSTTQNKLNKGKLCKACFNEEKIPPNNKQNAENPINEKVNGTTADDKDVSLNDRKIIDLIKQNMYQEKQWHAEVVPLLKDQISFLKNE